MITAPTPIVGGPLVAAERRIKIEANENLRLSGDRMHVWRVTCRHQGGTHYACLGRVSDGERWLWTDVTFADGHVDAKGVVVV